MGKRPRLYRVPEDRPHTISDNATCQSLFLPGGPKTRSRSARFFTRAEWHRAPPACFRSQLCSILASLGFCRSRNHAAADSQASFAVCARRNFPSACAGRDPCAGAGLLSSQGSSLPSVDAGRHRIGPACGLRQQLLLQSRSPRRGHDAVGASASLRQALRCPHHRSRSRRGAYRLPGSPSLLLAIHSRSSCLLTRSLPAGVFD